MAYQEGGHASIERYNAAIRKNIKNNALKTFSKNNQDIVDFLYGQEESSNEFIKSLSKSLFEQYGKLSETQCTHVRNIIAKNADRKAEWALKRESEKGLSKFVGEVGKRVELTLTVQHIVELNSVYGWVGIFICIDENGNKIIYKGSSFLAEKKEVVKVKATVKEHGVRDGENQTVIARPKYL